MFDTSLAVNLNFGRECKLIPSFMHDLFCELLFHRTHHISIAYTCTALMLKYVLHVFYISKFDIHCIFDFKLFENASLDFPEHCPHIRKLLHSHFNWTKVRRQGSGSLTNQGRGAGAGARVSNAVSTPDKGEHNDYGEALSGKCLSFLATAKTLLTDSEQYMRMFSTDEGIKVHMGWHLEQDNCH